MMDLKIASINICGFRATLKQTLVKDFILKHRPDIFFVQETFVDNLLLAKSI